MATAQASPCTNENFTTHVSGTSECLLMRVYGSNETPKALLVWLHGDLSSGGPANYHFEHAERSAEVFANHKVLSVALVRPGYPDGNGEKSSVSMLHAGRTDHYTHNNISQVGVAIERLKQHYGVDKVLAIGHSGGAATASLILGMYPGLLDAAILVSTPGDLVAWRSGRQPWTRSENPFTWIDKIARNTRIIAITGDADSNTSPVLAQRYVDALSARGVTAVFKKLPSEGHNSALRSPVVFDSLSQLLSTL